MKGIKDWLADNYMLIVLTAVIVAAVWGILDMSRRSL